MKDEISKSDIVVSKAGRDKGKLMYVLAVDDTGYLSLSDGKLRKVEKPKVKKVKHVALIQKGCVLSEKAAAGERPLNSEIRRELSRIAGQDEHTAHCDDF